ncbi:4-hydroxy-tetrahydrodipicolinate synthase [Helicovermis profundi]|uniref:4-hydroxy-tetrahydrodipicolinate synthase n=1 Tax=Helicovermis profundi TaxID=3065157 RepID=A0AAU9E1Z1_9FIRM|nr:4-hydroxy-tetrahydrodipicolinate synthase [Clostridia bacterium S502]
MTLFKGSGVAIVTPMNENGVNFEKLGELIDWQIENLTDAIIVCGTTGEASTLEDDEHKEVIKFAVNRVNKRVPLIAGTGSNSTNHAIMMSKEAEELGVDGLLCVTPYYNKATQNGLIKHYEAIADAVNIPIILYNVPSRTGVNIEPSTVLKLSQHKNIKAVKEASGNISQCAEVARIIPNDFKLYSGNDDMIVPLLSLGGDGVISVVANIMPRETHNIVSLFHEGQIEKSRELQLKLKPLIDSLFIEVNPIPVKTALNLMGKDVGILRLPLCEMKESNLEALRKELIKENLIK